MADEFAIFKIGGEDVKVPPLNLHSIRLCRDEVLALNQDQAWFDYGANALMIAATAIEAANPVNLDKPDHEIRDLALAKAAHLVKLCSIGEGRAMGRNLNSLFLVSGFDMGEEEATGESPGTGTQILSSPNSPLAGFVEATGDESNLSTL